MNEAFRLICPVCKKALSDDGSRLFCINRHSFDIARQGYINLLPVQNKHSLNPGDNKEMLLARRRFLDSGKYEPICKSVINAIKHYVPSAQPVIADIGCGEGYYTSMIKQQCRAHCIGIDVSKDGARMACSRDKSILWLVATASALPIEDNSLDAVTAMFSLFLPQEYSRVLKKDGCAVEITVGNRHLTELKQIIYEEVFEQDKRPVPCSDFFYEAEFNENTYQLELDNSELRDLLMMTPHFWRIRKEKREALEQTDHLRLTVQYRIRILIKK